MMLFVVLRSFHATRRVAHPNVVLFDVSVGTVTWGHPLALPQLNCTC